MHNLGVITDNHDIIQFLDWDNLMKKDQEWPAWAYEFKEISGIEGVPFILWMRRPLQVKNIEFFFEDITIGGKQMEVDNLTAGLFTDPFTKEHRKKYQEKALNDLARALKTLG
jgi:hypothetical protein